MKRGAGKRDFRIHSISTREKGKATDARSFSLSLFLSHNLAPPPFHFPLSFPALQQQQMAFMAEDTTVTIVPNFSLPAATGGFIRCIAVRRRRRGTGFLSLSCFFAPISLTSSLPLSLSLSLSPLPLDFKNKKTGLLRALLAQPPRRRAPVARPRPPRHEAVQAAPAGVALPGRARSRRRRRARVGLEV